MEGGITNMSWEDELKARDLSAGERRRLAEIQAMNISPGKKLKLIDQILNKVKKAQDWFSELKGKTRAKGGGSKKPRFGKRRAEKDLVPIAGSPIRGTHAYEQTNPRGSKRQIEERELLGRELRALEDEPDDTEEEMDELMEEHPDFVYETLIEYLT